MRTSWRALLCAWMAATIVTGGCRTPATQVVKPGAAAAADPNAPKAIAAATTPSGRPQVAIDTNSVDGQLAVETRDAKIASAQVAITNLGDADTRALHARLEPLPDLTAENAKAPTMRAPTPAPPRSGAVQPIEFVVATGKAVGDAPVVPSKANVPLATPQISPQGEVSSESVVRVRFSEPMVPIASVGPAATPVAAITPSVAGTWRWIDTRVATFTSTNPRLPQASELTVTVPAGTQAVSGARLPVDATATFSTAPIALAGGYPTSMLRPDSPMVVRLDQDFDAQKLAGFLRVTRAKGGQQIAYKLTTLAEAEKQWALNPNIAFDAARADTLLGKRYVVIAPASGAWPAGTELQIVLKAGAPSSEGPRVSVRETFAKFDVAPAFTLLGLTCGDLEKPQMFGASCPANGYVTVTFANPILIPTYRAQKVQLDASEFQDNKPSGRVVGLSIPRIVGKPFSISVGEGISDIYGQPLLGGRKLGFVTGMERYGQMLYAPTGMHVLDPRFEIPQWLVSTSAVASLRVQLFAVQPKDYFAYQKFEQNQRAVTPPGKRVFDKTYPVGPTHAVDLRVDLKAVLPAAGFGHLVAMATVIPIAGSKPLERQLAWIQVTKLGVSSRIDGEQVNAWVQDITPNDRFLAPIAGATTSLISELRGESAAGTTDAGGHAAFALFPRLPKKPDAEEDYQYHYALLQARTGTDSTFAVVDAHERSLRVENAVWYVTDDRFIYKPGEKAYVKGWVRWTHNGSNPDLALPKSNESITYHVADARGNKITSGNAQFSKEGGFHLEIDIPKNANLGSASIALSTRTEVYRHTLSIQEFRTPAYSVALDDDVAHSGAIPLILGESIEMTATAKYYAGGGLGGAGIQWDGTLTSTAYKPPGWNLYTFDPPYTRTRGNRYRRDHDYGKAVRAELAGSLSGASTSTVTYAITALPDGKPSVLAVDSTVTDVDRMSIRASSRPILVHPSQYYVGLRLRPDTHDTIDAIVTDIDGNIIENVAIAIELEGVLGSERYRDDAKVIDTQSCAIKSAAAPAPCVFKRKDVRTAYTARAKIADARGRTNVAQLQVPWWSWEDNRELSAIPDKPIYRPGDVAKIEIRSKVFPATAVVSFARRGIISQKRIELTAASTHVELPIDVAFVPNVYVVIDRYGKRQHTQTGSKLPIPETAQVEIDLPIDLESVRLAMRTKPTRKLVQPGENATFEVDVKREGKPVPNAEVALIVVDEAVLALASRSHADPLAPFYHHLADGTSAYSSLGLVNDSGDDLDGKPGVVRTDLTIGLGRYGTIGHGSGTGSGYGSGSGRGGMSGRSTSVVSSRKDFRPNAVFSPVLQTDANGRVSLTVKMPDNLTRYRIIALAASSGRFFGKAENTIVAQRKVNARTIAPRFLTQGDRFALPVVVQNLDSSPRTIDVAVRAANLEAAGPVGKRVTVPAGQRAEVRFEFATKARGRAVVQTIIASGDFADATDMEMPIYEPATTESFATYGIVDDAPQFEQLVIPQSIFKDVGGVEVELASTQLQSLTDAYWYLYRYPYECAEQRSGRMLATAALHDIIEAFATPGRPTKPQIDAQRAKDSVALGKEQRGDGGWGYFMGIKSDLFVTQQVLSALGAQKITGKVTTSAVGFVTRESNAVFAKLEKAAALPPPQRADRDQHPYWVALAASTLTSIGSTGADVRGRAERLHTLATTLDAYPVDAKARVLAILAKLPRAQAIRSKLLRELLSATHETAAAATVTTNYVESERLLLVSNTKTTALALDAIMRESPDQAIVAKLARGVLDGRRHGRWRSTQENLVALQTMRRYFDIYEKVTPNYTGKLWFGGAAYTEQAFAGRTNTRGVAKVDWTQLAAGTKHDLALIKQGPGRMYYRVGITYAPQQVNLPALDAGFIVRRSYTADDPADVVKTPAGYRIKLGAKVRVTLEVLATSKRHAVAVVDPLPAGFETVNTALATAERALPGSGGTRDSHWDHVNMRDNRTEAFRMGLDEGTHRFSYTVRATTPGTFIAAPAKAEEMYSPETFGRSTGLQIVVE